MLKTNYEIEPTEIDQLVFEKLVSKTHYLRQVKALIDFEFVRAKVQDCYSPELGRGAIDPVLVFKLEFLQFHYTLSDREVIAEAQVNLAFRYFLGLALSSPLPVPSLLSQFRSRLGVERYQALFDGIVAQARQHGLVKDRLRLKDATHVIANVAIPTTLQLVAQVRDKLLSSLQPYEPGQVSQARLEAQQLRQATADLKDEERLLQRVNHLSRIVNWAEAVKARLSTLAGEVAPHLVALKQALALSHKLLADQKEPEPKDQLRSGLDPDVRRGRHGDYYDGYSLDISLDADSELLTALNLLPANGDEAADAQTLIKLEQQAQGNQVAALSIDGIGFRGEVLRTLTEPTGLNLTVYVPPHQYEASPFFTAELFDLSPDGLTLTCPQGLNTDHRRRNNHDTAWVFTFTRSKCAACPLMNQCLARLPKKHGRSVSQNDYQHEYQLARQLAQTPAYAQVRKQHPRVERKLAEIVRYHGGRRTRYRGQSRVKLQYLLTGLVVNIKRMVRLLSSIAKVQPGLNPA